MTAFSAQDGAVSDGPVIQHFGDPIREQRTLERGEALAPLGDRVAIELRGADRLTWLDSITSQAVARLGAGRSTELLVLDPQGRVEHAAAVVDDGTATWLIADAADAEPLAAWLRRMVFRADVTVQPRPEREIVGFFAGGSAEALVERSASSPIVWTDPWPTVQPGGHQYHRGSEHPGAGYYWRTALLDAQAAAALAAEPEAVWAGVLAAEALRVAAWRPRWAAEVDDRSLPHETDWIRSAVHLDKGCYRGQETVAKVHNLGHPPRRLVFLHLDGSDAVLPAPGAEVLFGDEPVGIVTSVARHHDEGPIALAYLKRTTPVEADLVVRTEDGDVAAAQEQIVPPDAGRTAAVPRLPRLSRRR